MIMSHWLVMLKCYKSTLNDKCYFHIYSMSENHGLANWYYYDSEIGYYYRTNKKGFWLNRYKI
jgi:hypothetical protein